MTNTEEERIRGIVNGAVKKAFTEELQLNITYVVQRVMNEHMSNMILTTNNLTMRVGQIEERTTKHSMHAREQDSLLKKLSSGRAQLVYHAVTLLTILATYYAKN